MGVLKKLTDEYFGDTVRIEDGKKITVHGCDVIVPVIWDEKDFLKSVENVLSEDNISEFISEYSYRQIDKSKDTIIECGNSYHLFIAKYDEIIDEGYLTIEEIPNETTYNSIIKFLTYIVKDVDIDTDRNENYIRLTGEDEINNALYMDDLDGALFRVDGMGTRTKGRTFRKGRLLTCEFVCCPKRDSGQSFVD